MKISSGSYDLNRFLFGGYESDIITTIYGPAGSGKTNFCMMACASQTKKQNKVLFIDTEGGFSVERFNQITKEPEALKNVIIFKTINFEEQKKVFSNLLKEIKSKGKIGLIIVDGMTMLYRLELAEAAKENNRTKVQEINSELAKQMRILAEIARKMNIPILITNQVYSDFLCKEDLEKGIEKQSNMVGGDILKYWSKCLLEIKNKDGKRKIIIRKHRSLPEKELSFIITNDGIRKRGLF